MPKRSTIYEVAKRSGVSIATVSRVMGNGSGYSAPTRDRVLAVAGEMGWVPSASARGLATRRAGIVGLLFPDLGSSGNAEEESPLYIDQVIRGAEQAATAVGDAVLIAATRSTSGHELARSVAGKVDGLVIVARSLPESEIAAIADARPVVVLSERHGRRARTDSVSVDNRGGMRSLVAHLVEVHGYVRLAYIGGPKGSPDSRERFAGFRDASRAAGLRVPTAPDAVGDFTESGGSRAVQQLIDRGDLPEVVVCGNDEMAVGALHTLRQNRVRVPAEVAVTGFDDLATARHVRPQLTTVAQPMRELGAEAVRTVLARLADPTPTRQAVVLATRLMVRHSCGCGRRSTPVGGSTTRSATTRTRTRQRGVS